MKLFAFRKVHVWPVFPQHIPKTLSIAVYLKSHKEMQMPNSFKFYTLTRFFPETEKSQPSPGITRCPGSPTRVSVHCQLPSHWMYHLSAYMGYQKHLPNTYFFLDLPSLPHIKILDVLVVGIHLSSKASQHHYSFLREDTSLHWDEENKMWNLFLVLCLV